MKAFLKLATQKVGSFFSNGSSRLRVVLMILSMLALSISILSSNTVVAQEDSSAGSGDREPASTKGADAKSAADRILADYYKDPNVLKQYTPDQFEAMTNPEDCPLCKKNLAGGNLGESIECPNKKIIPSGQNCEDSDPASAASKARDGRRDQ